MKNRNTFLNPAITCIITAIALVGTFTGVLAAKNFSDISVLGKAELFSDDFYATLKNALLMKVLWTLPLILGGINIVFIPVAPASVFLKCCSFGYTAGLLLKASGFYGFSVALTGVVLHNFLFSVFSVIYSSFGINKTIECYLNRRNYDYRLRKNKIFAAATLFFLILNFIISVFEAYLSSFLYEI